MSRLRHPRPETPWGYTSFMSNQTPDFLPAVQGSPAWYCAMHGTVTRCPLQYMHCDDDTVHPWRDMPEYLKDLIRRKDTSARGTHETTPPSLHTGSPR
jgi:hypothetical protein